MNPIELDQLVKPLTIKDLRVQCRARGVSPAGSMETLRDRIKEHMLATKDFGLKAEDGENAHELQPTLHSNISYLQAIWADYDSGLICILAWLSCDCWSVCARQTAFPSLQALTWQSLTSLLDRLLTTLLLVASPRTIMDALQARTLATSSQ